MTTNNNEKLVDIRVFGVGGGGSNAVIRMVLEEDSAVEYHIINTDKQALNTKEAEKLGENRICIGNTLTRGLGAGSEPTQGRKAAEEDKERIKEIMTGADMVFVTAGMGGGTGTGAASVVASLAKEEGILTIGVVTKPFKFEGRQKMEKAESGIEELEKNCDTLIVVPNDRLLNLENKNISIQDAFKVADDVLKQAIQGVYDLIIKPGMINVDFADVTHTLRDKSTAHVGIGVSGEIMDAVKKAVDSPLLETSIEGATGLLINFASGNVENLNLFEVNEAASMIEERVSEKANIIFGTTIDTALEEKVKVTVIATGFDAANKKDEVVKTEELVKPSANNVIQNEETTQGNESSQNQLDDIPSFLRR